MAKRFILGRSYTRREIHTELGGSAQTFLPHRKGAVVCGAFRKKLNPDAPECVLVGDGKERVHWARIFAQQNTAVPVFVAEVGSEWIYQGKFRVSGVAKNGAVVRRYAAVAGRRNVAMVLFLSTDGPRVPAPPDLDLPSVSRTEGRLTLIAHLRRERNRSLVSAKKREMRKQLGMLVCECCGYEFGGPGDVRDGCCEVHHLKPLSALTGPIETRLADLAVVCANCHRMIHHSSNLITLERLRHALGIRA
jgi:hypothetical protein